MNKSNIQPVDNSMPEPSMKVSEKLVEALAKNKDVYAQRLNITRRRMQELTEEFHQCQADEADTIDSLRAIHAALSELRRPQ